MVVDRATLDVQPIADRIMAAASGAIVSDVEFHDLTWSNELVNHVIELKTTAPAPSLGPLVKQFNAHVQRINARLLEFGACLMPTAMHPWMDPHREMVLWPHENSEIYATFNRIFDCRGHGWANLQSCHINLPFQGDDEFGRLHAAVRLILPILPALAASSPFMDGRAHMLDSRLSVYRTNCARVPQCTGQVIPEPVFTIDEYHARILQPLYEALAPHDPQGVIQDEWANARGAIARFSRSTIEIRLLDVQECPAADLAIAAAVSGAIRLLVEQARSDLAMQKSLATAALASVLEQTIRHADAAVIDDADYLRALGHEQGAPCTAGQLWHELVSAARRQFPDTMSHFDAQLDLLLEHGPLARRILTACGPAPAPSRADIARVYRKLCHCLAAGEMLRG